MPFNFDKNSVQLLITLYQQHPDLYTVSSRLYKNKTLRIATFNKITIELNELLNNSSNPVTIQEVQKKIGNLRTQFFNELGKIRKSHASGAGSQDIYKPTWWCYELLHFLVDSSPIRSGESNLVIIESDNEPEDTQESETIFDGTVEDLNQSSVVEEISNASSSSTTNNHQAVKKRKTAAEVDTGERLLRSALEALCETKQFDHIDTFATTVATELRQVKNPRNLTKLKQTILNNIYEVLADQE